MSIQRYTNEPFGAFAKCENGDYVLYADHFAELHNLLSTLADIRAALGVGEKPMLGELAGIVREIREQADRDEKSACKMQGERDRAVEALKVMLRRHGCVEGCCAKTRAVLADMEQKS